MIDISQNRYAAMSSFVESYMMALHVECWPEQLSHNATDELIDAAWDWWQQFKSSCHEVECDMTLYDALQAVLIRGGRRHAFSDGLCDYSIYHSDSAEGWFVLLDNHHMAAYISDDDVAELPDLLSIQDFRAVDVNRMFRIRFAEDDGDDDK